ncbi:hypothetical protein [Halomonas sp. CKK8]|uniref:hypothetical protein n=1 Tax=Halomonas sp. CKK8 TaxID=3036127 RepID=UPI00241501D3|nr:hypothetical protein [Halomonas sp. CKK8]WFM73204.1 hypothetical protein P8934_09430 [Halomonas sp. CKK8]
MAERPDPPRYTRPIVPDPDASLSAPRWRQPPAPRVWPLWLLVLLLVVAGAALAWAGWQERVRLQAELARVSGELSNVHARFDAEAGRGEALTILQERLDELANLEAEVDAVIDQRLATLETRQQERLAPLEEAVDALETRLASQGDEDDTLAATLAATRRSLDALERAGEEGRAALREQLTALDAAREAEAARRETLATALEALEGRLADHRDARQSRLASLEEALADLADDVEALAGSRDDALERIETLDNRLRDVESGLRELRQAQLATSAQLEALRQ